MGVLPTPDVQDSPLISPARSSELSFFPLPSDAGVDVGGVKTNGRQHIGIHGGAKSQVTSQTDTHNA